MKSLSPAVQSHLLSQWLRTSSEGIFAYDQDKKCVLWNEELERISGIKAEEVLESTIDRAGIENKIARSNKQGFFNIQFHPLQNEDGSDAGGFGVVKAESARFHALFDQAPIALQIYNRAGFCTYVNSAWEILFDTPTKSLEGYNVLTDPQLKENGFYEAFEKAFRGEAAQTPLSHFDPSKSGRAGRDRWIEGHLFPIFNGDREVHEIALILLDLTDIIHSNQQIAYSEKRLQLLADTIPQLVWITDDTGNIEFINRRWFEYTGQKPGRLDKEIWTSVTHPEDRQHVIDAHLKSVQTGEDFFVEYRLRRHDSQYRWHLSRTVLVHDEKGNMSKRFGTATDIHDQKMTSSELAATKEMLEMSRDELNVILQGVGTGIIAYAPNGDYVFANESAATMAGYPSVEAFLSSPRVEKFTRLEMLDENDAPLSQENMPSRLAFQGVKDPPEMVIKYRVKGTPDFKWSILKSKPILDPDGKVKLVLTIFRDFTDRKVAEIERERFHDESHFLNEASRILASSLDYKQTLKVIAELAVPKLGDWCSIAIVDEKGPAQIAVVHQDPAMLKVGEEFRTKYPTDWNASTGAAEVLRSRKPQMISNVTEEMLAAGAKDAEHLRLMRALDIGSIILVPIEAHGEAFGVLTLVSGSRSRKYSEADLRLAEELGRRSGQAIENAKLYDQAQSAIRSRDSLISVSAHELLTPVSGSKLQMQLMKKRMNQGQEVTQDMIRKMIDQTERQLDRLSRLVNEMLDLSRINLGKLTIQRTTTDLSHLVTDLTERMLGQLQAADCKVSTEIESGIVGNLDSYRVEQVLSNLLSNASRYARGKPVKIQLTRLDQKQACIVVEDQGIGIRKEDQERVFQRFERAATIDEGSGLGLGLFVVKQIVEAHGGTVQLESEFGKGAKFMVCLPLQE